MFIKLSMIHRKDHSHMSEVREQIRIGAIDYIQGNYNCDNELMCH